MVENLQAKAQGLVASFGLVHFEARLSEKGAPKDVGEDSRREKGCELFRIDAAGPRSKWKCHAQDVLVLLS